MTPPGPLLASIFGLYLLAVITPGPNTFIVTRLALSATRRHAAWAVLGIAMGNTAWLCITLGGVAVLLQQLPGGLRAVRYLGGLTSYDGEHGETRLAIWGPDFAREPTRSPLIKKLHWAAFSADDRGLVVMCDDRKARFYPVGYETLVKKVEALEGRDALTEEEIITYLGETRPLWKPGAGST